jgi:hypothetical protein
LTLRRSNVDGFTERGDPMLVQRVDRMKIIETVGNLGAEARYTALMSGTAVNLRAFGQVERSFDGNDIIFRTRAVSAPVERLLHVPAEDRTYGRLGGSLGTDLGQSLSINAVGEVLVGRRGSRDALVSAALRYRF